MRICTWHTTRFVLTAVLLNSFAAAAAEHAMQPPVPTGARLGIAVRDVPQRELNSLGLEFGVRVLAVYPNSAADRAGIREGDVITELGERPVYSVARLRWLVRGVVSPTTTLRYHRDGGTATTTVNLEPAPPAVTTPWPWNRGRWPASTYLGVQLQEMTEQLREAFGAPGGDGVLVVEVVEGGPAANAGLNVGDVIVRIDRKRVRGVGDVYRALNYFEAGDEVEVHVVRNKTAKTIVVTLAAAPGAGTDSGRYGESYPPFITVPVPHPRYWLEPLEELRERWQHLRPDRDGPPPGGAEIL